MLEHPLVVIDQEAGEVDEGFAVSLLEKLQRAGERVAGAAVDGALVFYRRAMRAQVSPGRERRRHAVGRAVDVVAVIGEVGKPAVGGALGSRALAGSAGHVDLGGGVEPQVATS